MKKQTAHLTAPTSPIAYKRAPKRTAILDWVAKNGPTRYTDIIKFICKMNGRPYTKGYWCSQFNNTSGPEGALMVSPRLYDKRCLEQDKIGGPYYVALAD